MISFSASVPQCLSALVCEDLGGPNAELGALPGLDPIADRNNDV